MSISTIYIFLNYGKCGISDSVIVMPWISLFCPTLISHQLLHFRIMWVSGGNSTQHSASCVNQWEEKRPLCGKSQSEEVSVINQATRLQPWDSQAAHCCVASQRLAFRLIWPLGYSTVQPSTAPFIHWLVAELQWEKDNYMSQYNNHIFKIIFKTELFLEYVV